MSDGPGMLMARYRRRFSLDGLPAEGIVSVLTRGMESVLVLGGEVWPRIAPRSPAPDRPAIIVSPRRFDGRAIEVEMGYINWLTVGIAVRFDGALVHESHKGRRIAYPGRAARMARAQVTISGSCSATGCRSWSISRSACSSSRSPS